MPSSWGVYYVVFLSAILALGVPATLAVISYVVTPNRKNKKRVGSIPPSGTVFPQEIENQTVMGRRMNARFFLAANAALILITLSLILIPCVGILQSHENPNETWRALFAIVTISGFAALGLLYSSRKGDLSWLGSFQKKSNLS